MDSLCQQCVSENAYDPRYYVLGVPPLCYRCPHYEETLPPPVTGLEYWQELRQEKAVLPYIKPSGPAQGKPPPPPIPELPRPSHPTDWRGVVVD